MYSMYVWYVCLCVSVNGINSLFNRSVLISRPLTLQSLQDHAQRIFPGVKFTMYFFDTEVMCEGLIREL